MDTVNCTINGKKIATGVDTTILEAATAAGIYIPTLCTYPGLRNSVGRCQLCIVEIEGGAISASCTTRVTEGMVIRTETDRIKDLRSYNLKAILSLIPVPRLRTDELKKLALYTGVKEADIPAYASRNLPVDNDLMVTLDHNLCILCGRCAEVCREVSGTRAIDFTIRNKMSAIGPAGGAASYKDAGCRFCGACVGSCPTQALVDKEKWYGVGTAPCTAACPAGIDVPRYVYLVGERRFAEATAVVREKVPFPGVLGRICFHPCEDECRRSQLNEPIAIASLKCAAADRDPGVWRRLIKKEKPTGKKVAVVGSGPAGLTAAYYLARKGHAVIVFEQFSEPGGMMRTGIPDYRLPKRVLFDEIEEIKLVGVQVKTNSRVDSLDEIRNKGYEAVFIATGTHEGMKLGVPGEDTPGVKLGVEFLREVNFQKARKLKGKVVVIGGGNVAIDSALTALHLGAKEVQMACLERNRKEMPAFSEEVGHALEEGIVINMGWGPKSILSTDGKVKGVELMRCTAVFDKAGNFKPCYDQQETKIISADTVIVAIGQRPEIPVQYGLETGKGNTIKVDIKSLSTGKKGIFAGGDVVTGTSSVIEAIAMGRTAATSIDKYLGGNGNIDEKLSGEEEGGAWSCPADGFADVRRVQVPTLPLELRAGSAEVKLGLDDEDAITEAMRCLRCNLRFKLQPKISPPVK